MSFRRIALSILLVVAAAILPARVSAQGPTPPPWTATNPGSPNIKVVGHIGLGPRLSVADMDLEQEMNRPFAYVARMQYGDDGPKGMDIVDFSNESRPTVIYRWRIENQELHQRTGGMDVKHFKVNNRYYVVQSTQFGQGGPDSDMGAVILDVTSLPDTSRVREVARIREPETPGGFHNIFIYRHSNGGVYLFTTVSGPFANVYDLGKVVGGNVATARVARVPVPESALGSGRGRGYHDFYVGYHPDTGTDRFYGGGTGGYYVYDITDLQKPSLIVSLTGISGVTGGHTFTPSPDGRYVIAETEYQFAPLRIFDLQPALEGKVKNISNPIAGYTAYWDHLLHNHEVRWPYVFASGYLDGLQIFNLQDPANPQTTGYYDTYTGPPNTDRYSQFNGAFGVDIRNADGLIAVSDMSTGFWLFRLEGFNGWHGNDWGQPNVSSVQQWTGPMPTPVRWR